MIAIIGGGVVGLSIAFELAQRGETVTVYERGECGRGASWAAAGMLAPYMEDPHGEAMQDLCASSLRMYPEFMHRIRNAGGLDAHLELRGIVAAAFDDAAEAQLRQRATVLQARGIRAQWVSARDLAALEPAISRAARGGLLSADEGHVDNRLLGRALAQACTAAGVRIRERSAAAVEMDARRVLGVRTQDGFASAQIVINCGGVAAANVDGVASDCVPPIRPVKGQIVELAIPGMLMHRPVWVPGAYLVPRAPGRLLIGASVENSDDDRVTAGAASALLGAAVAAAPALRDFAITDMWAGIRPGTPDELPVISRTSREGYFVAAGHYRNGILLAPVTARMVAELIAGSEPSELRPFALQRFREVSCA